MIDILVDIKNKKSSSCIRKRSLKPYTPNKFTIVTPLPPFFFFFFFSFSAKGVFLLFPSDRILVLESGC